MDQVYICSSFGVITAKVELSELLFRMKAQKFENGRRNGVIYSVTSYVLLLTLLCDVVLHSMTPFLHPFFILFLPLFVCADRREEA